MHNYQSAKLHKIYEITTLFAKNKIIRRFQHYLNVGIQSKPGLKSPYMTEESKIFNNYIKRNSSDINSIVIVSEIH